MFGGIFIPESAQIRRSMRMDGIKGVHKPFLDEFVLEELTVIETNIIGWQELKDFLTAYSLGPIVHLVISSSSVNKAGEIIFLKTPTDKAQLETLKTWFSRDCRVKKVYAACLTQTTKGWKEYTSPHTPKE